MLVGSNIAEEDGLILRCGLHSNYSKNDRIVVSPKQIKMLEIVRDGPCGPQDADYSHSSSSPSLSYELESLIFGRFPRSGYWKLLVVNKRCLGLVTSGEIYKIRKEMGFKEASVFMFASGENCWWAFDRQFKSRRKLPVLPSDPCFASGDKESLCAGTHLLISGREVDGLVIWRYNLANNKWYNGPSMIDPRCLFASATCGDHAYVAGGMGAFSRNQVHDTAEMYNAETGSWAPLPRMNKRRKLCSGFYMDDKFHVIGGRNEEDGELTCGESFDKTRNTWELIPDMLKGDRAVPDQSSSSRSPPLVAVVNNELYSLEASSNQLKVYLKHTNTWRELGRVPVRADSNRGWGVAFKSLGNELLVIGGGASAAAGNCMAIYTCCPVSESGQPNWKPLDAGRNSLSHFILNCSVMLA